ncbi:hypothetical protein IAT38_006040 [Cryptococcus sp. DSM 104549]
MPTESLLSGNGSASENSQDPTSFFAPTLIFALPYEKNYRVRSPSVAPGPHSSLAFETVLSDPSDTGLQSMTAELKDHLSEYRRYCKGTGFLGSTAKELETEAKEWVKRNTGEGSEEGGEDKRWKGYRAVCASAKGVKKMRAKTEGGGPSFAERFSSALGLSGGGSGRSGNDYGYSQLE